MAFRNCHAGFYVLVDFVKLRCAVLPREVWGFGPRIQGLEKTWNPFRKVYEA